MGIILAVLDGIFEIILFPFRKFPKLGLLLFAGIIALGATGFHSSVSHLWSEITTAIFGKPGIPLPTKK